MHDRYPRGPQRPRGKHISNFVSFVYGNWFLRPFRPSSTGGSRGSKSEANFQLISVFMHVCNISEFIRAAEVTWLDPNLMLSRVRLSHQTTLSTARRNTRVGSNPNYGPLKNRCFSTSGRLFSPAAALANDARRPQPQTTTVSPRVAARNVLKSTIKLIPRTLGSGPQKIWEQRAQSALDDLETGRSRPVRIAGMYITCV